MKKIIIYCIILNLFLFQSFCVGASVEAASSSDCIFYVSPAGDDNNPGTESEPWKTMYKAANTLTAGQTAIFEDGVYEETQQSFFRNSGTADKPITLMARNRHKAILRYSAQCSNVEKLNIWSESKTDNNGVITFTPKQYITIKDFEITQEQQDASSTRDILVNVERAANCNIIGNKIHKAYEEGIKVYLSSYITIADNDISDTNHEGIDCFALASGKIYNNIVSEFGRDGYMIKGNTCNTLVYGNIACNKFTYGNNGFDIGGASNGTSPICIDENGYENYNSVFSKNIVYAEKIDGTPSIKAGFAFLGAKDCQCINNTIIGTQYGVRFLVPDNSEWERQPNNINPVVKNNIMSNVTYAYDDNSGSGTKESPKNVVRDYNLFINCGEVSAYPVSSESHSIVTTENIFVSYGDDWHILKGCAADGTGADITSEISAFAGFNENGITKNYPLYEYNPSRTLRLDLIGCSGKSNIGALSTYEPSFITSQWKDDMSVAQRQDLADVTINRCSSDIIVNDGANKVMALGPQSTSQNTYWNPTKTVTDSFKISMKVKVADVKMDTVTKDNNNSFIWRMYFFNGNTVFGDLGMRISYPNDDVGFSGYNIRINNGVQTLVSPKADGSVDWIKLDAVFDNYTKKMTLYVNDAKVKEASIDGINLTQIVLWKPSGPVDAVTYFDDLEFFDAVYGYTTTLKGVQVGIGDNYSLTLTDGYGETIEWNKGPNVRSMDVGAVTYYGKTSDNGYSCTVNTIRHYGIEETNFKDADGNSVSLPVEGGSVSDIKIKCNIKSVDSAKVIFAYFNGAEIKQIKTADVSSLSSGETLSIPLNFKFDEKLTEGALRIFVLEDFKNIKPIDTVENYIITNVQ